MSRCSEEGAGDDPHPIPPPVDAGAPQEENAAVAYHVGRTLAGRYQIERWIGEGSMGAVVAARHLGLDERVAIKLIRSELRRDPLAISRFAREAKALAQVKSDHITRVLDVGVSLELGPFIVLEYLEGRDLGQLLNDEGPLPAARAVDYILQACEALAAAHRAGIIHRDIKPENLFLARIDEADTVKVLDFGISTGPLEGRIFGGPLSQRKLPDILLGTPLYMAPERVRNEPDVDQRADIWSLGAVLYELISGRTLYVGESPLEVCARVLEHAAVPLELGPQQAPPELVAVIARCLQKDPEARFGDVGELGRALQPFAPAREPFYGRRTQALRLRVPEQGVPMTTAPAVRATVQALAAPGGKLAVAPQAPAPHPPAERPRGGPIRQSLPAPRRWAMFGAIAVAACSVAHAWRAEPSPVIRKARERHLAVRPALDLPAPAPGTSGPHPSRAAESGDVAPPSARGGLAPAVAAAPLVSRPASRGAVRRGGVLPQGRSARVPTPPRGVAVEPGNGLPASAPGRVRLVDASDRVTLVDDHPAVLQGRASRLD